MPETRIHARQEPVKVSESTVYTLIVEADPGRPYQTPTLGAIAGILRQCADRLTETDAGSQAEYPPDFSGTWSSLVSVQGGWPGDHSEVPVAVTDQFYAGGARVHPMALDSQVTS